MSALSDAIRNDLVARIYDQLNGRVLIQHPQVRQMAAEIAVEVVASYVDIVTDLATNREPLCSKCWPCPMCDAEPDGLAIDLDAADVKLFRETDHWHAPTCEWRRAREVCGHPKFRD